MIETSNTNRTKSRGVLHPREVGSLTHAVAVTHLRENRPFEVRLLRETVDEFLSRRISVPIRQAARQRVITSLVLYREELVPCTWRFFAGEQIVEDVKLDLLWLTPDDRVVADELKTGGRHSSQQSAIARQCASQCSAGREVFGQAFEKVRVVFPSGRLIGEMRPENLRDFEWH